MQYLGFAIVATVLIGIFVLTAQAEGYWYAAKMWVSAIIVAVALVLGMKLAQGGSL
ncbi:hypothetical protein D3C87_1542130 [compost metagenome]